MHTPLDAFATDTVSLTAPNRPFPTIPPLPDHGAGVRRAEGQSWGRSSVAFHVDHGSCCGPQPSEEFPSLEENAIRDGAVCVL